MSEDELDVENELPCEEAIGVEEDEEGKRLGPGRGRAKKPNRKQRVKINYTQHGVYESESEAMLEVDKLGRDLFGVSSKGSGLKYKFQVWTYLKKTDEQYRIGFCHFYKESGCGHRIKLTKPINSDEVTVWIGDVKHSDHSMSNRKRGLSSFARTKESPLKMLCQKPKKFANNLCDAGINVSPETRKKTELYLRHVKHAIMFDGIERGSENTFGAVATVVDRCMIPMYSF